MTRTARAPRLNRHLGEPFVEVHPVDALRLGLSAHSLAEVASDVGTAVLRVVVTDRVSPGQLFAPMHWTGETAPRGRIDAVVAALTDPLSGQPDSKSSAVSLQAWPARWFAFAASAGDMAPDTSYWARRVTDTGHAAELAEWAAPDDIVGFAKNLFALPEAEVVRIDDPRRGLVSLCLVQVGRVAALLFAGPAPVTLARDTVIARIGTPLQTASLAPRAGADQPDSGPMVCACTGVGRNAIDLAIRAGACSVSAIGAATGAGTNCGACRPEIAALLALTASKTAAE